MANQTVYHLTYPAANLFLAKKWDIAKHEKHLNKLKEMKPAIDMEAPVGFGKSEKDILERARKEVKRISKEQEALNTIHEGNLKILKKISAIKLDTHKQWLLRESIVKKSPFNPFLERRLKEQKRIEKDNNKLVLKVETQKSGIEYQKKALLKYYERNKNVGRKYGDFSTEELHQPDILVRVNEQLVVPRNSTKSPTASTPAKTSPIKTKTVVKAAPKVVQKAKPVAVVAKVEKPVVKAVAQKVEVVHAPQPQKAVVTHDQKQKSNESAQNPIEKSVSLHSFHSSHSIHSSHEQQVQESIPVKEALEVQAHSDPTPADVQESQPIVEHVIESPKVEVEEYVESEEIHTISQPAEFSTHDISKEASHSAHSVHEASDAVVESAHSIHSEHVEKTENVESLVHSEHSVHSEHAEKEVVEAPAHEEVVTVEDAEQHSESVQVASQEVLEETTEEHEVVGISE